MDLLVILLGLDMAVHIAAGTCFVTALKGCKYKYKEDE